MELTYRMLFFISAVLILLFYRYLIGNYNYWKKRRIPSADGVVPGFGHLWPSFSMKKHFNTVLKEIYEAHNTSSMVGLFAMRTPLLLVRDVDLIKTVLLSEFKSFRHHQTTSSNADPLLHRNPFVLNDQEWRDARREFLTMVTTKKLKVFSVAVRNGASKFVHYMNNQLERESFIELESRDIFEKITMEISANAILSVEEGMLDEASPKIFRKMMKSVFEPSTLQAIRTTVFQFLPVLNKIFRVGFVPHWINREFTHIVGHLVDERKNGSTERNDVLQNLIEYCREKNLPNRAVIADAFSFFFDTLGSSSVTMSFLACVLAEHPRVQNKLREEINSVVDKFDGEISYEAASEMTYLDQVISESMRLNPAFGILRKICSEATVLTGLDGLRCEMKPGDQIALSIYGIHQDPQHWKNPAEFRPERFDKKSEEFQRRHKYAYIPFGEGPRMCPGMRMGVLQVKLLMATIVRNFLIEKSPKLREPITLDPKLFASFINGGAWIRLKHLA